MPLRRGWPGLVGLATGLVLWWQGRPVRPPRPPAPPLAAPLLQRLAENVTVKVVVGQNWGSGVLVARQGTTYTLVTNQHVLEGDSRATDYQVLTPDGHRYPAQPLPAPPTQADVAALRFRSTQTYPLACPQPHLPTAGEPVFAAGFPFPTEGQADPGLVFTTGQVSWVLPQPLEGGYRLGYTNAVEKGMSGGPVLNRYGRLVALNGMHKDPLWGDPYRYADGTLPDPALRSRLGDSSWGIPIGQVWQELGLGTPACASAPSGA
ncbi:MAG: serine protease [Gloeomargarita sp. DG02_3_bins_56]